VNLGGARADDVHALIEMARAKVEEGSGIVLEPEVRLVGDW
jgi:UDP-N-acetylenolpyruvoylglucosamine reductase